MKLQEVITCRLTGLIREVALRGPDGRWQLRLGLEDTVAYAEYMQRPMHQGPASGESLREGIACVLKGWEEAMVALYPDVKERAALQERFADWLKDVRYADSEGVSDYLAAIAANLARRRVAA